jgi:hypothetical protein
MTYLALLRRFGPWIIIAVLIGWVLMQRTDLARKDAKLQHLADVGQITVARINAGVARAEAADRKHAMEVGAKQDTISKEAADDIAKALDEARALAVAHARDQRLLAALQAADGSVSKSTVPTFADATRRADAAGQAAELDDIACAEAVTKAEAWPAWWARVSAIPR